MIRVEIRYFNLLAVYAGVRKETLELPEGFTVNELVKRLAGQRPGAFSEMLLPHGQPSPHLRIFRNEIPLNPPDMDAPLKDGDVYMLFPAIAGG